MLNPVRPIGVMDSGIGGLTVVRKLQEILPGEDIIYFGDSANCPYGNKTSAEILELSSHMLRFLENHDVKCTAIACCTISNITDQLQPLFHHNIFGIIESAAHHVAQENLRCVGLIGTEFTISSGNFEHSIHKLNPNCQIVSKGSPLLASLIERGDFNQEEINFEIKKQVDIILSQQAVGTLILGCTHYPIVEENFHRCYPSLALIDAGVEQAYALKRFLKSNHALNPQGRGKFIVYTSGDPGVYLKAIHRLQLFEPDVVETVQI